MYYRFIFLACGLFMATPGQATEPVLPNPLTAVAPIASPATTPLPQLESLLTSLVDGAIRPLYLELQTATQTLAQQSGHFCQTPTVDNFKAVREAWLQAMLAWQRTDALLFGPAIENQVDFLINFTPPKKLMITKVLTDTTPLTVEALSYGGAGAQGLSTIEYLLFDREQSLDTQLSAFQGDSGKRRCTYVQVASEIVAQYSSTITQAWLQDTNSYATAFKQATRGNRYFANGQQAIDLLITKLYQSAEKTAKTRIGKPLGKTINLNTETKQVDQITMNAYALEGWRSGSTLLMARASIEGIQRILQSGGLLVWLREQNLKQTSKFVADSLERQVKNYLNLPLPQTEAFTLIEQGKIQELEGYYYLGNALHNSIKRQLARLLNTPLGFNDKDGD